MPGFIMLKLQLSTIYATVYLISVNLFPSQKLPRKDYPSKATSWCWMLDIGGLGIQTQWSPHTRCGGVEVQEVRKNEVSVKRERIMYICPCKSHSANFLKVCSECFFLHDALMSFLTSVCCRFSRPRFSLPYRHFQHSRCSGRVEELLQGDEAERGEHHGYRNSSLEKMCF